MKGMMQGMCDGGMDGGMDAMMQGFMQGMDGEGPGMEQYAAFMKGMAKGKGKGCKPGDWFCPSCGDQQFAKNAECRKCGQKRPDNSQLVGVKPGDWICPACQDFQFAKNKTCRLCGTPNPDPEGSAAALEAGFAAGHGGAMERPGDWYCPGCGDLQFAKNAKCRKCETPNPDPLASTMQAQQYDQMMGRAPVEKPGDWYCPSCNDLQFARNAECRKCGEPNPNGAPEKGGKGFGQWNMKGAGCQGKGGGKASNMKPGDWHCTSCGDLQFARNEVCRQCGTPNYAAMMMSMMHNGKGGKGPMGAMGKGNPTPSSAMGKSNPAPSSAPFSAFGKSSPTRSSAMGKGNVTPPWHQAGQKRKFGAGY